MPEGPSILILKELAAPFRGKKVIAVAGNSKVEKERALGEVVTDFKSWGKHFLICFRRFAIKIHLMLFGSYRINEDRDTPSRLTLKFKSGFINFYACSVTILDQNLDEIYDWSADVMSDQWDPKAAKKKLQAQPSLLACDALLDQNIFAGSGNIIKNEVLFRIKVHPKSLVGALPTRQINQLIKQVRVYSFDFLNWKKAYVLRKHWLVHNKSTCARCERPLTREYLGRFHRRTFYCSHCQILYE
jgi:endonuclease-8